MMKKKQEKKLERQLIGDLKDTEKLMEIAEIPVSTELSSADNHPGDNATDLTIQLTERAVEVFREQHVEKINSALDAMEEGTYGKCAVCGVEIPKGRLDAIPTTLTCVEHANKELDMEKRPVEEGIRSGEIPPIDFHADGEMASSDGPQDKM